MGPALVDALAAHRRVITFDNAGVGATTGRTPNTVEAMARDAIAFLEAMDLQRVDLLGFSIGSFVAREIALIRPDLLRRIVLASSAPQADRTGDHCEIAWSSPSAALRCTNSSMKSAISCSRAWPAFNLRCREWSTPFWYATSAPSAAPTATRPTPLTMVTPAAAATSPVVAAPPTATVPVDPSEVNGIRPTRPSALSRI
ncbi:MAG TPA: alpha/beta fold hydrolase [Actinomycetes bacterium]|nr:alpha/beta fold hydrolase [Actinomycetes bacterium]